MREADHLSRGVLPSEMCLSVIMKPRQCGGPGPLGSYCAIEKSTSSSVSLNYILL